MSIRLKLAALVVVLVAFAAATAAAYHVLVGRVRDLAMRQAAELLMDGHRQELKDLVDSMAATLADAVAGARDEGEVHRIVTALVQHARFFPDRSGYYFVYKVGGTVFVHPTLPELEGQDLRDKLDPRGVPFIRRLDQVSRAGGGWVEYGFDKPGKGVLPKLSYAHMIPGTNYWIGTGVYIEDVEEKQARALADIREATAAFLLRLFVVLANAFLVIVVPLVAILASTIVKPLRDLTRVAEAYSLGQLGLEVPGLKRKDEIGSLARALGRLGVSMKSAMRRLG